MIMLRTIALFTVLLAFNSTSQLAPSILTKAEYAQQHNPLKLSGWGRWMLNNLDIWKGMLSNPTEISALTASNPFVIDAIIKNIQGAAILELGAGTGPITIPAIKTLLAQNRLTHYHAIECVPDHAQKLIQELAALKNGWSTSCFSRGFEGFLAGAPFYAEEAFFDKNWKNKISNITIPGEHFDTIISTLPWTRLSYEQISGIMDRILELLKTGGKLIWVSLWGARTVGGFKAAFHPSNPALAEEYFKKLTLIDAWFAKNFDQKVQTVWSNVTPMLVYCATKKAKID